MLDGDHTGCYRMAKLGRVKGIREETGYQRRNWVSEEKLIGIKCCLVISRVKMPMVELPMQAPRRSLHQGDRSPANCRLLAPL